MILLPCLEAREISLWPYDRLHKEADLIIVGVPEKSADTGELVRGMLWQRDFPGVNTIFNVTGVLKGRYKASSITLFHLRQPDNGILDNGPYLATFNHQPIIQPLPGGKRRSTKQEYLLFLKKRDDGRYEPVSGPMDSAHAIREMNMAINAQ
jgi:hypothetical protein